MWQGRRKLSPAVSHADRARHGARWVCMDCAAEPSHDFTMKVCSRRKAQAQGQGSCHGLLRYAWDRLNGCKVHKMSMRHLLRVSRGMPLIHALAKACTPCWLAESSARPRASGAQALLWRPMAKLPWRFAVHGSSSCWRAGEATGIGHYGSGTRKPLLLVQKCTGQR
jgi:hypothetical protein